MYITSIIYVLAAGCHMSGFLDNVYLNVFYDLCFLDNIFVNFTPLLPIFFFFSFH